MMLYFKRIVSEFHDIDLMISVDDVEVVKTILRVVECRGKLNE